MDLGSPTPMDPCTVPSFSFLTWSPIAGEKKNFLLKVGTCIYLLVEGQDLECCKELTITLLDILNLLPAGQPFPHFCLSLKPQVRIIPSELSQECVFQHL